MPPRLNPSSYAHACVYLRICASLSVCYACSESEEQRTEEEEAAPEWLLHFMSLQTGALDSRSLAYFWCHSAAKSDYYPAVLGHSRLWNLFFIFIFFLLLACTYVAMTKSPGLWLSFRCAIRSFLIGGDATFPDHVINTYNHFPNSLYFGSEGRGNPHSGRLSFFCGDQTFLLVFSRLAAVGRPQGSAAKKEEAVVGSRPSGQLLLQRLTTCEIHASIKIERWQWAVGD